MDWVLNRKDTKEKFGKFNCAKIFIYYPQGLDKLELANHISKIREDMEIISIAVERGQLQTTALHTHCVVQWKNIYNCKAFHYFNFQGVKPRIFGVGGDKHLEQILNYLLKYDKETLQHSSNNYRFPKSYTPCKVATINIYNKTPEETSILAKSIKDGTETMYSMGRSTAQCKSLEKLILNPPIIITPVPEDLKLMPWQEALDKHLNTPRYHEESPGSHALPRSRFNWIYSILSSTGVNFFIDYSMHHVPGSYRLKLDSVDAMTSDLFSQYKRTGLIPIKRIFIKIDDTVELKKDFYNFVSNVLNGKITAKSGKGTIDIEKAPYTDITLFTNCHLPEKYYRFMHHHLDFWILGRQSEVVETYPKGSLFQDKVILNQNKEQIFDSEELVEKLSNL